MLSMVSNFYGQDQVEEFSRLANWPWLYVVVEVCFAAAALAGLNCIAIFGVLYINVSAVAVEHFRVFALSAEWSFVAAEFCLLVIFWCLTVLFLTIGHVRCSLAMCDRAKTEKFLAAAISLSEDQSADLSDVYEGLVFKTGFASLGVRLAIHGVLAGVQAVLAQAVMVGVQWQTLLSLYGGLMSGRRGREEVETPKLLLQAVHEGAKKPSSEMVTKYVQLWGQEEAQSVVGGGAEAEAAGGGAVVGRETGPPRVDVDSGRGG